MSLNRYNPRRDANEPEIISAFEVLGLSVIRCSLPCDLLIGHAGRSLLVEVKTPAGKLTSGQWSHVSVWQGNYSIVLSANEAIQIATWFKAGQDKAIRVHAIKTLRKLAKDDQEHNRAVDRFESLQIKQAVLENRGAIS